MLNHLKSFSFFFSKIYRESIERVELLAKSCREEMRTLPSSPWSTSLCTRFYGGHIPRSYLVSKFCHPKPLNYFCVSTTPSRILFRPRSTASSAQSPAQSQVGIFFLFGGVSRVVNLPFELSEVYGESSFFAFQAVPDGEANSDVNVFQLIQAHEVVHFVIPRITWLWSYDRNSPPILALSSTVNCCCRKRLHGFLQLRKYERCLMGASEACSLHFLMWVLIAL